jgi:hypothetical protein
MNAAAAKAGYCWLIQWRLRAEYRQNVRRDRLWQPYLYRGQQPKPAELRALQKRHPASEFRIRQLAG